MSRAFSTVVAVLLGIASSNAIKVEFLQASIDPAHVGWLSGLACRNLDRMVHLDIRVEWPDKSLDVETSDYRRLIFWDKEAEYLFPKGSYSLLHGSYIIKGYFIVRSGGIHQGMVSNAFEKAGDPQAMFGPGLVETRQASSECK